VPQGREGAGQVHVGRQAGTALAQPLQQPCRGAVRGGLDVDRQDVGGQARQQAGLEQRRFAAAARPVQHADREGQFVVGLDAMLPEAEALRQAVGGARPRQEFEEKVGVVASKDRRPWARP